MKTTNLIGRISLVALMGGSILASAAQAQDTIQVGIVSVNYNSPSVQVQTDAAIAAAEALGWEVELFDGQGDQVATNNAAIAFIDRGFDAIINTASANPQMTAVIAYAKEAGIPFVSTFSGLVPGITADIGSNNTADGVIAATELVGRIGGVGHVIKMNWTVLPALAERDAGFHAVMSQFPGITITEIELKVPGQVDDAYNQMTNLMLANDDIVAVWAGWDEPGTAAARAIEQAGMSDKIFVVSMDGTQEALSLIRGEGPYELTVAYDVERMGVTAVEVTAAALKGNMPGTQLLTLRPCLITEDTAPPEGQPIDFENCELFSGEMQ
ncbi:MAG: sugar ABC transporter substrate-binding protein [Rhodobacter sp.]|nr:sugar ABC transporter substrate-binding protein [Rhodobacter sp.]MCA3451223.1 sugar ABC transporter substrate-binding protein [Rhodobacter sp.]